MWEFLGSLSESAGGGAAGVLAVVLVLILVGVAVGARYAWRLYRDLAKELADARKENAVQAETIRGMREAHEAEVEGLRAGESRKRAEMRAAFEAERADRERRQAARMDALNEARVADLSRLLERVVKHVETTKAGLEKLLQTLEVLISITRS